uniref:Dolichyl-diphosphooligosaccharide-protein glycosyltransferase subunit OST5 n=1 Tax=Triticum urartu TaxID=4572 RepID=A0A8R7URX9_TRIUA
MASISSPLPVAWYPALAVLTVAVGLMLTASFFIDPVAIGSRPASRAAYWLCAVITCRM